MLSLQRQIKWSVRALWALALVTALMLVAFYVLAYRPQTRHLQALCRQVDQSRSDLAANQNQTSILPRVQSEVAVLSARLARYKALPRQQELAQFIRDIAQLGQQASLNKFNWNPGATARKERCNEQQLQISFEGDFVNVFSFLRHAEDLRRMARVRNMSLKTKDRQGQVKAQLTMSIYFAFGD